MDGDNGPVIPNFGQGDSCVTGDHTFCWSWVHDHWSDTLGPALWQHVELTLIAVVIGFAIAFPLALLAHRFRTARAAVRRVLGARLHDSEPRALPATRPVHRASRWTTVEIALVGYTLVILFPNIVAGLRSAPDDVIEAARGMGLTRLQVLTPRRAAARAARDRRRPAHRSRLDRRDRDDRRDPCCRKGSATRSSSR